MSDRDRYLSDEDLRQFQKALVLDAKKGKVISGTGGFRKIRWSLESRGKSGGCRVIYLHLEVKHKIYLALIYGKNEQDSLSDAEKKALKAVMSFLKLEE